MVQRGVCTYDDMDLYLPKGAPRICHGLKSIDLRLVYCDAVTSRE
jgi:hypothetical protein